MAKGRMINKRIAKSDRLVSLKTDRARVIYFMIYPHLDVAGRFSGDPRDIKEDCCPRLPYTLKQIAESIIDLDRVALLELYEDQPGRSVIEYYRYEDFQDLRVDREAKSEYLSPRKSAGYEKTPGGLPADSRRTPLLYLSLSLSLSLISSSGCPSKENSPNQSRDDSRLTEIESVVAYLNEKAGKKFNPGSKPTAERINARLSEGRTVDDLKRVIDLKVAKWKGRTWKNSETGQLVNGDDYLRPSTLFGPENFENYVNEAVPGRPRKAGERDPGRESYNRAKREYENVLIEKHRPEMEAARAMGNTSEQDRIGMKISAAMDAWAKDERLREGEGGRA